VDSYHGTSVADPYSWMEDPDSAETTAWVDAQVAHTRAFLDGCPSRDRIRARFDEVRVVLPHGLVFLVQRELC
jgi:prolyl oligopeptidase